MRVSKGWKDVAGFLLVVVLVSSVVSFFLPFAFVAVAAWAVAVAILIPALLYLACALGVLGGALNEWRKERWGK